MGERKGQNKYYPPDYDPKKGGLNKFRGTHALRERARKIHLGIIIIRFEMPYNIWCDGCKNHIGMGVRYNAEKTKVGMYYSTPIYKFRMKCHLCDNHFEIQTDPGNLDYVILSGARRQENRWDPHQNEQVVPETKEVQKRLFDDAMYKLEHQAKDVKAGEDAKPVLERLVDRNRSVWDDSYEANCRLRAEFRLKKKELKAQKELDDQLLARNSLDITLLPETVQDKQMAGLMMLQSQSAQEREAEKRLDILMKPALPGATKTTFGGLKRQKILSTHLQFADLGIKKKTNSACEVVDAANIGRTEETCYETKGSDIREKKSVGSSETCYETKGSDIQKNKSVGSTETCYETKSSDIRENKSAGSSETSIEQKAKLKTVEATLIDLPKSLALVCDYDSRSDTDNSN